MKGLKEQERDQKLINFFEIVQNEAKQQHCVFFLSCAEGNEKIVGDMDCMDFSGWLIPEEKADDFEKEWIKKNAVVPNFPEWEEFFTFAIWNRNPDNISIEFNNFSA